MRGFEDLWLLLALVGVYLVAHSLMVAVYLGRRRWMRASLTDTAGTWLHREIHGRGLSERVRVLVQSDRSRTIDWAWPQAGVIGLGAETYLGRDPGAWAAAAHELGHVLLHRRSRVLASVLTAGRVAMLPCVSLMLLVLSANVIYRSSELAAIAYGVVLVALAGTLLVLVDEVAASITASKILRGAMHPPALRAARITLAVALGTYLVTFLWLVALAAGWRHVQALATGERPGEASIEGAALWAAAGLSCYLLLSAVLEAKRVWRPPTLVASPLDVKKRLLADVLADGVRGILVLALLFVIWDAHERPAFVVACVLALVAARVAIRLLSAPIVLVLVLPLTALVIAAVALHARLRPAHITAEPPAPPLAEVDTETALALLRATCALINDPPWYRRMERAAMLLGHVPAIVLFWALRWWA